jgi:hypothetical protein
MGHIYRSNMVFWALIFAQKGSSVTGGWYCRDIITVDISFEEGKLPRRKKGGRLMA